MFSMAAEFVISFGFQDSGSVGSGFHLAQSFFPVSAARQESIQGSDCFFLACPVVSVLAILFVTPQGGSFRFGALIYWIVCLAQPRDDGVPCWCVLPGPSFCVRARCVT